MTKPKRYLIEYDDNDGYGQRFSGLYGWGTVLEWVRKRLIQPGDKVYEVIDCKQPKLPKDRE
jgi:hypothetical protein